MRARSNIKLASFETIVNAHNAVVVRLIRIPKLIGAI